MLAFFLVRRRDVPLRTIYWLFVAFILSCGTTHLVDASMFYFPAYRFLGVMKAVTAVVSLLTVVMLAREMPGALKIPELLASREATERQLEELRAAESRLLAERNVLEARGAALTARDRRLRNAMRSAKTAAATWERDTGKFVWEVSLADLVPVQDGEAPQNWSEVLDDSQQRLLREAIHEAEQLGQRFLVELDTRPLPGVPRRLRIRGVTERAEDGEPRLVTAMMGYVPDPNSAEALRA